MLKEKVKELWKLCFDDSEQFVEMYFRMRYKEEINMAILSGSKVISALQMIPYPMTFCGHTVQTSYISGACTHPDFRGKGVMHELLSRSFARMFNNGIHFSTLIPAEPWLFGYYSKTGYSPVFQYSLQEIAISSKVPIGEVVIKTVEDCLEEAYDYLNRKLSERPCCVQHTQEDFKALIADLALSKGSLLIAQKEKEINGIAVLYQSDEQVFINELFAEDETIKHSLLHFIEQKVNGKRVIQLLPPRDTLPTHTLGMARIINAKEILQLFASTFPEKKMLLQVFDEQLPENNGYYSLYEGNCICINNTKRASDEYIPVHISELTNLILRPLQPYMSLMLN